MTTCVSLPCLRRKLHKMNALKSNETLTSPLCYMVLFFNHKNGLEIVYIALPSTLILNSEGNFFFIHNNGTIITR